MRLELEEYGAVEEMRTGGGLGGREGGLGGKEGCEIRGKTRWAEKWWAGKRGEGKWRGESLI